jgi:ABC-2 type transport system ATP-binding protein
LIQARSLLDEVVREITLEGSGQLLQLRLLDAANHLPAILDGLRTAGFQTGEISLRSNSLEDVFIQLTGRRLRE